MPQLPEQLSFAFKPGLATLSVGSKTPTSNIKNGSLEGTTQLFRISQNTQTPQIPTQPVCKLLSYPLIFELANIQSWLEWYHPLGFELQIHGCCNKPSLTVWLWVLKPLTNHPKSTTSCKVEEPNAILVHCSRLMGTTTCLLTIP